MKLHMSKKLWIKATLFSCILLIFTTLYTYLFYNEFSPYILNKIFANTSVVLIALSMGLASISQFFPYYKKYIKYRKHLGLLGFYCVLLHGAAILLMTKRFPFPDYFLQPQSILPFLFAVLSTGILTVMALISRNRIRQTIHPKTWRKLLRLGHIALIFGLLHFGLKSHKLWIAWIATLQPMLPPPSLLAFILGVIIITVRIAMQKNKKQTL